MTSENEEDAIMRLNRNRPISNGAPYAISLSSSSSSSSIPSHGSPLPPISMAQRYTRTKPNPRFLSFFLRAIVMALVISLFFLFVGIAAIVLVHICIAGRILHHRRTTTTTNFQNSGEDEVEFGVGLSPNDLRKLPSFYYGSCLEPESVKDCAVCLEGFKEGERCRILPGCNHVFHANCIDTWLIKSSACPICRGSVELETDIRSSVFRQEKFADWI